jgi:hypothetical protein
MRNSPSIEYQMFRAAMTSTVSTSVVERKLSWLNRFWRLKVRYAHQADIHLAFLQLSCVLISCVFSANHVQLARTVGLERRARPLLYQGHDDQEIGPPERDPPIKEITFDPSTAG